MIDVATLLNDPDLSKQTFTLMRRHGNWQGGRFIVSTTAMMTLTGIIAPPKAEALRFVPEGERRESILAIYTSARLNLTEGGEVADEIIWHGERYKVIRVDRYDHYGFCVAYVQKR